MKNLQKLLKSEVGRQETTLNLIASENIISPRVLDALATPFANKYAEGYPGKRYYGGNEFCDAVENEAITLAKEIFKLGSDWHANVQPYSGSPANAAIYMALMNPGDTVMGLKLSDGGHLTHGHPITFSGTLYRAVHYRARPDTGRVDYEALYQLAKKYKPKVIISGFSAYPRKIDFRAFRDIATRVGAYHIADISHIAGLVVAGVHPSPFPYADVVMTTTHKTLRGPRGAVIFCRKELAKKIDRAVFPGLQGGPHMNVIYAKAVAFEEALKPKFKIYQRQILKNAQTLSKEFLKLGYVLVSGGTDIHLLLIDLRKTGIDGTRAEKALEQCGIIVNRNSIPGDEKPFKPSGIRIGTPALTTRGMKEGEMCLIAGLVHRVLRGESSLAIKKCVRSLTKEFPINRHAD
ncbi:MAG: serine hydroxymethyltransferase [Patescibacteria group bacterium]